VLSSSGALSGSTVVTVRPWGELGFRAAGEDLNLLLIYG
jgi:hypothetical protein